MPGSAQQTTGPAWEEILAKLRQFYLSSKPFSFQREEQAFRIELDDIEITKYLIDGLVACEIKYRDGYLNWMQVGDNTVNVLSMYGAQPEQTKELHLPGKDDSAPLSLIAIFRSTEPEPHWIYITFGLSDLYSLEGTPNKEASGFGFELTMRVPCDDDDYSFPTWPQSFLHECAKHIFQNNSAFEAGQFIDSGGPLFSEPPTTIEAFLLAPDVLLEELHSISGRVQFLQLVGVSREELEFANIVGVEPFLVGFSVIEPTLITDPNRQSYLSNNFARAFHKPVLESIEERLENGDLLSARDAAMALSERLADSEGPMYYETLLALGNVYCALQEYNLAESTFEKSLQIVRAAVGEKDTLIGNHYFLMGNMYAHGDQHQKAEEFYAKAKNILVNAGPQATANLAEIHTYLGMLQMKDGRNSEAEANLKDALKLGQKIGKTDPDVVANLLLVLDRQGKNSEASKLRAEFG